MRKSCPVCGDSYGFLDSLSSPSMCVNCFKSGKSIEVRPKYRPTNGAYKQTVRVKKTGRSMPRELSFILHAALYAGIGALIFLVLGTVINFLVNNEGFKFQWGLQKKVGTDILESYRLVRNVFIFIGTGVGLLSVFLDEKNTDVQNETDLPVE